MRSRGDGAFCFVIVLSIFLGFLGAVACRAVKPCVLIVLRSYIYCTVCFLLGVWLLNRVSPLRDTATVVVDLKVASDTIGKCGGVTVR